jgi:catechol 2,3-dioxygenase-like lactoylglutathione lyase family enzyme
VRTVRGLAEVVLSVRDIPTSVAFYRDTLGLEVISPPALSNPVFLQAGEGPAYLSHMVALIQLPLGARAFSEPRPLHHLAFAVDAAAFDVEHARLQALGYEVRSGQHPVFPSRTLYITDPDGNEVELISPTREGDHGEDKEEQR